MAFPDPPHAPAGGDPLLAVEVTLPTAARPARDAVTAVVDAHLRALRIPGRPEVTVSAGGRWELRVDGGVARCPAGEVAGVVQAVTRGRTVRVEDVAPDEEAALAGGLCAAALQARLSVLLGPARARAVLDRAGVAGSGGAAAALATVVDHGVALDDAALAEVVGRGAAAPVEVAERLLDRGQAATLDVLMAPGTLRRLTSGADTEVFAELREGVYAQLGVLGPDFHLGADAELAEDTYAFTLNSVRTWPRHLPPGAGLRHVADALADLLSRRAAWFVSVRAVEEMNDRLEVVLPDTIRTVRDRYPLEWLTAVARAAVDEGTSLRNLATVVDRLLDLDPHPSTGAYRLREGSPPPGERGAADLPAPRDAVALVRQRLREEVARTTTVTDVTVRRLSPPLEARLDAAVRAGTAGPRDAEEAAAEVRSAHPDGGLRLAAPSLALRAWLRDVLRGEFPDLRVVALTEYPPALDVRTVRVADA